MVRDYSVQSSWPMVISRWPLPCSSSWSFCSLSQESAGPERIAQSCSPRYSYNIRNSLWRGICRLREGREETGRVSGSSSWSIERPDIPDNWGLRLAASVAWDRVSISISLNIAAVHGAAYRDRGSWGGSHCWGQYRWRLRAGRRMTH